MSDAVRLTGMRFHAFHGCLKEEAEKGGTIVIDLEISGDLTDACITDELDNTFDFRILYDIVSKTVLETRYNLLEALGQEICSRLRGKYPQTTVRIVLRKPHPAGLQDLANVEVELNRG
jgi:dihydroneopterin aldolase